MPSEIKQMLHVGVDDCCIAHVSCLVRCLDRVAPSHTSSPSAPSQISSPSAPSRYHLPPLLPQFNVLNMACYLISTHPCFVPPVCAQWSPTSTRFFDSLPWFDCYASLLLKQIHSMECFSETTSSTDSSCKSSSRTRYVSGTPKRMLV